MEPKPVKEWYISPYPENSWKQTLLEHATMLARGAAMEIIQNSKDDDIDFSDFKAIIQRAIDQGFFDEMYEKTKVRAAALAAETDPFFVFERRNDNL